MEAEFLYPRRLDPASAPAVLSSTRACQPGGPKAERLVLFLYWLSSLLEHASRAWDTRC